ncbi:phosphotransferase family protein [Gordonia sp. NB41Y]|uniref:phosphotransferase family protein n=1 Tax=Gordonia sp. NB41Y TaxID=875808 RepID=UPI0002BF88B7|nr:phosphotransferase family protein [Gordonia sp. NB41Y]WLP89941.1 phosphotransferase family protein [Gordonia sp. NB41Y]
MNTTPATGSELDPARTVRGEDAFDIEAVATWLRQHMNDPADLDTVPEIQQFTGGVSNLTYLLRYPTRDLILRRPPIGSKAKSAHDMRREYDVQSLLKPVFDYVPEMIAFCDDETILGSDFYVMERLKGRIMRRDLPADLHLRPDQARELTRTFVDRLVDLHQIDLAASGLDRFSRGGGYVDRQVNGWSNRYVKSRTPNVGSFENIITWLKANQPADRPLGFIHNDYRLDNLVLDPQDPLNVVGILDWEMATVGDPLMDLGSALAYWVEAGDNPVFRMFRRQPSNVPGMLTRAEIVDYYASRTGQTVTSDQWRFYEVFGLFRLAVIAQQVYYRYFHKQTTNQAYKQLRLVVIALEWRCTQLIATGRLAPLTALAVPITRLLPVVRGAR